MSQFVLAIDQGTTSSRAILFDQDLKPVATGQQEFQQIFPDSGWVEHDPEEIWKTTLKVLKEVVKKSKKLNHSFHRFLMVSCWCLVRLWSGARVKPSIRAT